MNNCRRYNAPGTRYAKCALSLERIWDKTIAVLAEKGWEMEEQTPAQNAQPEAPAPKAAAQQQKLTLQTDASAPLHGHKGVHPSPTASTMMQVVGPTSAKSGQPSPKSTKARKEAEDDEEEEEEEEDDVTSKDDDKKQ